MKKELTESDYDRAWAELKNTDEFTSKPKIITYFEQNLIPSFKAHAAIWILKQQPYVMQRMELQTILQSQ